MYRLGFTPWDSGIPPPELIAVIEGARRLPPGRALDLGCGTGTTAVYMASHGWQMTGVDFVPKAIRVARAKASVAGLPVVFLRRDLLAVRVRAAVRRAAAPIFPEGRHARRGTGTVFGVRVGRGEARHRSVWLALVHHAPPLMPSGSMRLRPPTRW